MKTIFAKIFCVFIGFFSLSILCFGFGILGSSRHSGFADIRDQIVNDFQDLYNDPAFHIEDKNITSITITDSLANGATRCDVWIGDDVLYDAYIDRTGKGIRCCEIDGRVYSASFWHRINKNGLVRFNWMLLWEDLTLVLSIYIIPLIILIILLL